MINIVNIMRKAKGFGKAVIAEDKSFKVANRIVTQNINKLAQDIPWILGLTREEQEKAVATITQRYIEEPQSFMWVIYHPDPMIFAAIPDVKGIHIEAEVQEYIQKFSSHLTDEMPFWGRVEAIEQDTEAILAIMPTLTRKWLSEDSPQEALPVLFGYFDGLYWFHTSSPTDPLGGLIAVRKKIHSHNPQKWIHRCLGSSFLNLSNESWKKNCPEMASNYTAYLNNHSNRCH